MTLKIFCLTILFAASFYCHFSDGARSDRRREKLFSLFSVVSFKNDECDSTLELAARIGDRYRKGVCFSSTECSDKNGLASGNCAAGFGVCCVLIRDGSGDTTISENCTYVQNEGYPRPITAASSQTYTVNKVSNDVCVLRLDFERFTLVGTDGSDNVGEGVCIDSFNVETSTAAEIPTICGENTGEHIYVDIGSEGGDTAELSFETTDNAGSRLWDIKISQIECDSKSRPRDPGCLQWFTGRTGRITSFNYANANDNHLNNQQYSICIRQESGFCCVQYQVCPDQLGELFPPTQDPNFPTDDTLLPNPGSPAGFSFDTFRPNAKSDTQCQHTSNSVDYIAIQGSFTSHFTGANATKKCMANYGAFETTAVCSRAGGDSARAVNNRYCGRLFHITKNAENNIPICDCTPPFSVDVFFNNVIDDDFSGVQTTNLYHSRGFCLEYMQIAC